jgi:hypothetical protein
MADTATTIRHRTCTAMRPLPRSFPRSTIRVPIITRPHTCPVSLSRDRRTSLRHTTSSITQATRRIHPSLPSSTTSPALPMRTPRSSHSPKMVGMHRFVHFSFSLATAQPHRHSLDTSSRSHSRSRSRQAGFSRHRSRSVRSKGAFLKAHFARIRFWAMGCCRIPLRLDPRPTLPKRMWSTTSSTLFSNPCQNRNRPFCLVPFPVSQYPSHQRNPHTASEHSLYSKN